MRIGFGTSSSISNFKTGMEEAANKPGRWRRWVVGFVSIAVVVLVAVAVWPGEKEPEYQGKKLSMYIRHSGPMPGGSGIIVVADGSVGTGPKDALLAVPAIRSRLSDPDAGVRAVATNALVVLAPEALK